MIGSNDLDFIDSDVLSLADLQSPLFSRSFSIPALVADSDSDSSDTAYGVALAEEKHQHAFQCVFDLDNLEFDLCPLLRAESGVRTIEDVKQTPPTVTKRTYHLALRRPLDRSAVGLASAEDDVG